MGVTTSSNARHSTPNQFTDKVLSPSENWATLDGGMILGKTTLQADGSPGILEKGFILGTSKLMSEEDSSQKGWRGTEICSNVQNAFSSPYPQINVTFNSTLLKRCRIAFDSVKDEYATNFTVITKLGGVTKSTTNILGNTSVYKEVVFGDLTIDEIQVVIYNWNKPCKQAKVMEFNIISDIAIDPISITANGILTSNQIVRVRKKGVSSITGTGGLVLSKINRLRRSAISTLTANANISAFGRRIRKQAVNLITALSSIAIANPRRTRKTGSSITGISTITINKAVRTRRSAISTLTANTNISANFRRVKTAMNMNITATGVLSQLIKFLRIRKESSELINAQANVVINKITKYRKIAMSLLTAGGTFNQLVNFVRIRKKGANQYTANATVISGSKKYKGTRFNTVTAIANMKAVVVRMFTWQGPFPITRDNYRTKENPVDSEGVLNYISVKSIPLTLSETVELYNSIVSNIGENTIIVNYSEDMTPVKEATVRLEKADSEEAPLYTTIVSSYFYAKSAFIKINSTQSEDVKIIINGKYLSKAGTQILYSDDKGSIVENGKMAFSLPDNPLIQTPELAKQIADLILDISKDPSKDMTLSWRGNPAIELSDTVELEEFGIKNNFVVIRQEINYDGALSASMKGRKK